MLKMTRVRRHYKMTKCVFFVRHCERAIRRAWQSINLSKLYHKNSSKALKTLKNSANRPQAHHKKFQWIATNLHAHALQILAMTSSLLD